MNALIVESIDGEAFERETARQTARRDKYSSPSGTTILGYPRLEARLKFLVRPFTFLCRLRMPPAVVGYECVAFLATVQDRQ
jgi:hypothetical protein